MGHSVYIGYESKDKPVADAVCAHLELEGIRCWIAPRDFPLTSYYLNPIDDAIRASQIFLFIFSSASNESPYAIAELTFASDEGIAIIPLRIEEFPLSDSMEYLIRSPYLIDAIVPPLERSLETVSRYIKSIMQNITKYINVRTVNSSVCSCRGDVLLVRYNPSIPSGIDKMVINRLKQGGIDPTKQLQLATDFLFIPTKHAIGCDFVLFVVGKEDSSLHRDDIEAYVRRAFGILFEKSYPIRSIIISLQGMISGLDAVDILAAELAGILGAINEQTYPRHLETITFAEYYPLKYERIAAELNNRYPKGILCQVPTKPSEYDDFQRTSIVKDEDKIKAADNSTSAAGDKSDIRVCNSVRDYHEGVPGKIVFVSHHRPDRPIALKVVEKLEENGIPCWIAPRDIGIERFNIAIIRAIRNCRVFLLVMSSKTDSSDHVETELSHAMDNRKPRVTFLIENTPIPDAFSYFIGPHQMIDAYDPPLDQHIDRLVALLIPFLD